jgi:nucleoid-associated protein YgaU
VLNFQRAEIPTALAGNQFLVVQPGNSLWRIARHVYGLGPLYTEIYHANRSEIVDPNIIYPGQIVTAPPG